MCCESDNEDLFRGIFDYDENDVKKTKYRILRALKYAELVARALVDQYGALEADEIDIMLQTINELEDSDYDSSVAQACFENASKAGDTLELKLYMTDNSIRTVTDASQITSSDEIEKARVELKFTYAVAFFGIEQEHVLSGYAL